jgi:hypothetical protein
MHVVINIRRTGDNRIEGDLRVEPDPTIRPFASWLELLRLLEQAASDDAPDVPR